jgi:hypothetical protein
MKRDPVISTSIKSIGWENNQLEVEYPSGSVYLYDDVSHDIWQKLRISQSIGKSLRSDVVNMGNPFKKIYDPNKPKQEDLL